MFSSSRKQAQQIARQFLTGHCGLVAWWTLRHAGVLEAIAAAQADGGKGLDAAAHAGRTNMSPEVLEALLDYLSQAGLVGLKKDGVVLTADGEALYHYEDGVLELIRAYQPVLDMAEHLLARLKNYGANGGKGGGVYRKTEYLLDAQAKRYQEEVFPAVAEVVAKYRLAHLLDITCGTGDLLMHVAGRHKRVVGVGIGSDGFAVRRANEAIAKADLEKRLIAVTASPVDVCAHTERTFDRIGISRQLWKEINCVIASHFFSEYAAQQEGDGEGALVRLLSAVPVNFPTARLMVIEPVASARFARNYYAPELTFMLRLARSSPWTAEKWRDILTAAKLHVMHEEPLTTDGLMIFLCRGAGHREAED